MHPLDIPPSRSRTPLTPDEKARGAMAFAELIAEHLRTSGRFRVTADTPDTVELFQAAARRAGDALGRRVVSYSNGKDITVTFADQAAPVIEP